MNSLGNCKLSLYITICCMCFHCNSYIFLISAEPPSFSNVPQEEVQTTEGADIEIICNGFGSPRPRISWRKNKLDLPDNVRYRVLKKGNLRILVRLCLTVFVHLSVQKAIYMLPFVYTISFDIDYKYFELVS